MAMSVFYNLLKSPRQIAKPKASKAKSTDTESIITQVQKPGTPTTSSTPYQFSSPKSMFSIGKCIPTFMANCLTRKRDTLLKEEPSADGVYLLGKQSPAHKGRKTLVLDLDETLVHSSFEKVKNADAHLSLTIKGTLYNFSIMIRPGTEEFLEKCCENYEVVIFTASLMDYAKAVMKLLHKADLQYTILAREHCTNHHGTYVKDLTKLGRNIKDVILVDNSPNAFRFQPENAYHIKDFFEDKKDRELYTLLSCLEHLSELHDVRPIRTHRMIFESKSSSNVSTKESIGSETSLKSHRLSSSRVSTRESIGSEASLKSHRLHTAPILKTEEALELVKFSSRTPRGIELVTPAEAEAMEVIKKMIDKKKNSTVKTESIQIGLLAARIRTTELSNATKSTKEDDDELMIRQPVEDNHDDELDIKCRTETELPLISLVRENTSDSGSSDTDSADARDTDERIYYAIEARVC